MKLRIFSFVLAMMLALSLMPMAAMAASGEATQEPAEIVGEPVAEPTEDSELSMLAIESETAALPSDGGDESTTPSHPTDVRVCGVKLTSGKYYTAADGVLSSTGGDTAPASGYVHYDASTGVLTLNNISLTANGTNDSAFGLLVPRETTGAIELSVIDECSLNAGDGQGVYMEGVDCTVTGMGTLNVTSAKSDAIYVKSLTVNTDITLNATAENAAYPVNAIVASKDIVLKGTVTAKTTGDVPEDEMYQNAGNAISSSAGSITIEGDVTAEGNANALNCAGGTFYLKGGKFTAANKYFDAIWAGSIQLSAGELNITKSGGGGLCADGAVTVSGTADVTINIAGTGIYSEDDVTISGGTVNLNSTNGNAIYTSSDPDYGGKKIIVCGGTLTASSSSVALWGNTGIEISGGTVTAVSSYDTAIYSPAGAMTVSGGTVAATTKKSDDYFSITMKKNININGDAVVYAEDYSSRSGAVSFTEGVIYTGTAVSLDTDGKTVLTGGVGTVYGNPNVTGFAVPTGSKLGTVLDDYVKIQAEDTPYTGGKAEPHPLVRVEKIALDRNLVEGEGYTVETTETKNAVGENSFTIEAVDGSGNVGSKDFDVNVTEKELKWDVSDITVSKVADGKTDAAQVQGTLKLVGVVEGETVTLSYTSLTAEDFTDSKAGDYNVKLTVSGAKLEGADAGNYKLPTADIMVTATIKEAAPTATAAPTAKPAQSPKTGDEANLALWLGLLTVGMAAAAAVTRRKKEN